MALLMVLLLLLGPATAVLAEDLDEGDEKADRGAPKRVQSIEQAIRGKRHQGPLFVKMALALEQVGYDSNLFNDEEDATGAFSMTLAPQLEVMLPVGAHQLFQASGKLGLVAFSESPPGNYINVYGGVRYDLYRKRVHFSLTDHFARDRRRFNVEFNQRILMNSNEASAEVAVRLANRLHSGFNYHLNSVRFDSGAELEDQPGLSLSEILDRDEHKAGWRSRYGISSRSTATLDLDYTDYRFKMPDNIRESYEWSASTGIEINEPAVISGVAQIGYTVFRGRVVEDQDFDGVLWNAALTWKMSQRFHLLLESRRDRVFSAYTDNLYFLNTINQPTIRIHLQDLTWLGLGYAWSNSLYPVESIDAGTAEAPNFVGREDEITGPVLTLRHQTGKQAGKTYTMGMEARYLTRESNAVNSYERFFVFFSFQVEL